ncbi:hypothetical protein Bca52824_083714 [Brassica carinata]|uniref:Uncharacterized protein n=1 Tax=Brassica carinata TaxID=52824 RepID=A0A8X7PMW3_BRACI|nr:hypothetical protein Bca52824_083714 [Brassica carinata]
MNPIRLIRTSTDCATVSVPFDLNQIFLSLYLLPLRIASKGIHLVDERSGLNSRKCDKDEDEDDDWDFLVQIQSIAIEEPRFLGSSSIQNDDESNKSQQAFIHCLVNLWKH